MSTASSFAVPNLYNHDGSPWWHGSPPYEGPDGITTTHRFSCVLYDAGCEQPEIADYIWAISSDLFDINLPDDVLAVLVNTLDIGGAVALHGVSAVHVDEGKRALLPLVGGGHA